MAYNFYYCFWNLTQLSLTFSQRVSIIICSLWRGLILCCINVNVVLQLCNFLSYLSYFCELYFWTSPKYLGLVVILKSICANRIWTLFNKHAWGIFWENIFHGVCCHHWERKKKQNTSIYSLSTVSVISWRSFKCFCLDLFSSLCAKLQILGPL